MTYTLDSATLGALHEHFVAVFKPRIEQQAGVSFRRYSGNPEMMEELTQEALGLGWKHYLDMKLKGEKNPEEFISVFAERACQGARSGRSVNGQERARSISNPRTQIAKSFARQSLPQYDSSEHDTDLLRAIQDERDSPPDIAAYLIDTKEWLAGLPEKKREMALDMAAGETTTGLAEKYRMTLGRVSQIRRELVESNRLFHGDEGPSR
jgi:DNA-directed RNA polymerase specialized sigma24 family protein